MVKTPPANAGDSGEESLISGLGRFPGVGNGNPLEESMDRRAYMGYNPCSQKELDRTEHACRQAVNRYKILVTQDEQVLKIFCAVIAEV